MNSSPDPLVEAEAAFLPKELRKGWTIVSVAQIRCLCLSCLLIGGGVTSIVLGIIQGEKNLQSIGIGLLIAAFSFGYFVVHRIDNRKDHEMASLLKARGETAEKTKP